MRKNKYIFILIIGLCINIMFFQRVYAEDENSQVVKVGLFILEPYVYLNSSGELEGYYVELFDLICEKMNMEAEYKIIEIENWLKALENREVDIILGASITKERREKFIFNKNSIALEKFAIYTNKKDIDLSNFQNLNGLRYGYVSESATSYWIFNFFKSIDVEVQPIIVNSYLKLEELMENDGVDLMIDSYYSKNKFEKIYEFIGDQVYVGANKEDQELIDQIDKAIEEYKLSNNNKIDKLYNRYFDEEQKKINISIIFITLIVTIFLILYITPKLKRLIIRRKIKERLKENRYLLYYQPIYNSINNTVVGFEALLRLKDKKDKLISPAEFIPEIEKNNMLFDITLWIIEKVLKDYKEIEAYKIVKNNEFYISINLSIDEIQNDKFVDKAIDLLKKSGLKDKSICLEIVERVGINDLSKIINNIYKLKKSGFKIAIDDFGIEYSNLDVIEKLDADIIKVDKEFVDGLGKDLIKDETILFILRVAKSENKFVILEGVEEEEQDKKIKKFNNKTLFVQGYFYNKPMPIESIKTL